MIGEEKEPKWQPISNWAPIVGSWTFETGIETYNGPQKNAYDPFGLCTSNVNSSEGSVKASVELLVVKDGAGKRTSSSGRIVLGYRSPNERYFNIGLGGYEAAYVLSEFEPAYGWRSLLVAGSEDNLIPKKQYMIEVHLAGQKLRLSVDEVRIFEYILEQPLSSGQVGLFAWGAHPVKFSDVAVKKAAGRVFVVMQFSEPYQQLYTQVIQPVAQEFGLQAYHAGEVFGPGVILQDIVKRIIEAKIVIAEITPEERNENVFYELGYAHALGKSTILLAERGRKLPFDVTGYRCLFYENSIGGKKEVEKALRTHLQAILFS